MGASAKNKAKNALSIIISILIFVLLFFIDEEATAAKIAFLILIIANISSIKITRARILVGIEYFILGLMLCASIIAASGRGTPEGWWAEMWDSVDLYMRTIPAFGFLSLCWWISGFLIKDEFYS